ncbi:MAG: glycosyltransferase [Moorea sp. SIO1F2]|uniref:glycosyltransferase n=1 Tax=Moorena sp. SIO1F2 TaxID=2607819 RepID=UPI0013BB4DB4|nr:glycosyltransferase [Moorena sp. SIO1F2]NET84253.1 glycosyltransferase [Moorena sp. SIO1F2]
MNYIKILAKPFRQVKKFYHSSLTQYPTQLANPGLANPGQLSRLKILKSLAKPVISSDKTCMVSVVIGSYNRRPLLEKAIQSVRDNQIRVPYEIIVIDGGSTDGSLEWLIQQKDIITIIQHNRGEFQGKPLKRRSWGYFMNLGFKSAKGKYILMISDDCLLLPNAVNLGLDKFEEVEKAGLKIGGVAFYFRNWPEDKEYYVQHTLGGKLFVNHGMYLKEALAAVDWADEERYIFYKADGDLCLKMWELNYEIVDCPGAYVEHYYDRNEAVRQTNNAVLDHDREAYLQRWEGIYYHRYKRDLRRRVTRFYEDKTRTADQFMNLVY